jgi:hypothetical protein
MRREPLSIFQVRAVATVVLLPPFFLLSHLPKRIDVLLLRSCADGFDLVVDCGAL